MTGLDELDILTSKRDLALAQYMAMGREHPDGASKYREVEQLDREIARLNGTPDPIERQVKDIADRVDQHAAAIDGNADVVKELAMSLARSVDQLSATVTALAERLDKAERQVKDFEQELAEHKDVVPFLPLRSKPGLDA